MSFSKWLNNFEEEHNGKKVTHKQCFKLLDKVIDPVIDNQITQKEKEKFNNHIENCMPCFEKYNLAKTIKQALKAKCCREEVPGDLIESIKLKIAEAG